MRSSLSVLAVTGIKQSARHCQHCTRGRCRCCTACRFFSCPGPNCISTRLMGPQPCMLAPPAGQSHPAEAIQLRLRPITLAPGTCGACSTEAAQPCWLAECCRAACSCSPVSPTSSPPSRAAAASCAFLSVAGRSSACSEADASVESSSTPASACFCSACSPRCSARQPRHPQQPVSACLYFSVNNWRAAL